MTAVAAVVCALCSAAFLARGPEGSPGPNQLLLLGAYLALGVVVWREAKVPRARRELSRRLVLGLSGGLLVLAVIVPPTQSGDVWAYAMYGRIVATHHDSPYTHAAADYPHDPASDRVDRVWRHTSSVYGPGFTALSAAGMRAVGSSRLGARLFFQLVAALAVAASLFLIGRRWRDPLGLACVGLNPVIVLGVVNNAHNDALVGLAVLATVVLVLAGRPGLAAIAGAAGALVKVSALLPLAAVGWWLWRRRGWRPAAAFGVTAVMIVSLGFAFAGGRAALQPLKLAGRQFTGGSIWNGPQRWLTEEKVEDGVAFGSARRAARTRVANWAALAVLGLAAVAVGRRLRPETPAPAVGGAVFAYMLGAGYVYPWYAAWSIPTLAAEARSRLAWVVMAHAAVLQFLILRDPKMLPDRVAPLSTWTGSQRLLEDLYRTGFPLLQVALIVGLMAVSLRRRAVAP